MIGSVTSLLTGIIEQLHGLTGNYGVAIIILTILIRVVLLPLTSSQTRAMKKMQQLQPEIQKLQKKYRNDPQRLNQETMALWREHKVNPLSGCLPVLIQLPFLWAFFAALRGYDFQADPSFLWIPDLASPDPWVLPILTGLSTYFMTRMSSANAADPSQRVMLYAMPVFLGWITRTFPAGLGVYWVTNNLFQIAQQYYMEWADRRAVKGEAG